MPITREQPAEVFQTSDGQIFLTAELAHTHEREEALFALAVKYSLSRKSPSLVSAISDLAVQIAQIVRSTPLAETKLLVFVTEKK